MSEKPKIQRYADMRRLVARLRDDLHGGSQDFVLLYAYNGTGKTRLSMEFKDAGKRKNKGRPDTLYFNAYTEDLFSWDNDLERDSERRLHINTDSSFFKGLKELALEERIGHYLARYADFLFDIDYDQWTISFRKGEETRHIKVSRGEENIFIWCVFMAICERVIDGAESYRWVIDGPVGVGEAPRMVAAPIKAVISSHHALFFNVVCNELKKSAHRRYFLHRPERGDAYTLRTTNETPFFHHVAMLAEVKKACDSGRLYAYHFNVLRGILEKTATFFGNDDFGVCVHGVDDEVLYARALNLMSHETYTLYQPVELAEDNKRLFRQILDAFLQHYQFELPDIFAPPAAKKAAAAAAARH